MRNFLIRTVKTYWRYLSWWHFKRVLTFLVVDFILLAFVRRRRSDAVLVVRIDLLGDYIIGRNFMRVVREYDPYRNRRIYLCANVALRELIETYDSDIYDGFIWIDRDALLDQFWPRYRMLSEVKRLGAQVTIHPMRDPYLGDCVVRASGAPERIGIEYRKNPKAAPNEPDRGHTTVGNLFYTRIVPERHLVTFEFYRNRIFFAAILPGVRLPENVRLTPVPVPVPKIEGAFAVLMPGASKSFREWPPDRFAEVARHLYSTRALRSVVLGSRADHPKGEAIRLAAPGLPIENLCGELKLSQVVYLMSLCAVGVTNDSGGIHILAALNRPGVAISNSYSFGWFHPYPKEVSPTVSFVYPASFYESPLGWEERQERFGRAKGEGLSMAAISVAEAIARIDAQLDGRYGEDPVHALRERLSDPAHRKNPLFGSAFP